MLQDCTFSLERYTFNCMQGPCMCEVYSRQEDSWIQMFSFEVYESVQDVFWVMEDVEVRKKQGKRKREREMDEYIGSLIGKTEEDVRIQLRILATIITESSTCTGELVLNLSLPSLFYDKYEEFHLAGTLHGVICLFDNFDNFLIWNPSIRKFSTIPVPPLDFDWDADGDVEDLPYFGFWIDPCDKHYKIIMFKLECVEYISYLGNGVLYSSIHQEWEAFPLDEISYLRPYAESPPVMVAYWRANYDYTDEEGKEFLNILILSYDFGSESFGTIQVPNINHYNGWFHPTLCCLEEDILALVSWEIEKSDRFDVHVWVEDEWVNIMALRLPLDPETRVLWVLYDFDDSCRIIRAADNELVLSDDRNLWHSLKSGLNEIAKVCIADKFVESLVFPLVSFIVEWLALS